MNINISRFIFFLLLVVSNKLPAQNNLDTLLRQFANYRKQNLQEKIYLHVDRNFYVAGETMWFKIYLADGTLHKPLGIDKVAYVELIDEQNTPVLTAKIQMENGLGNGSFFIPASLSSENYTLRAYTQWMKNYSPEFYFHKNITIVNTFRTPDSPIKNVAARKYQIDFFPEGGHLVNGLKSKLAFKITDQNGKSVHGKLSVLDTRHDTIAIGTSFRFGIGHLNITPGPEMQREAIFTDSAGNSSHHTLPFPEQTGYVMNVSDSLDYLRVKIASNKSDQATLAYLFVHCRHAVVYSEGRNLSTAGIVFSVPKKLLGHGINHLTVFDAGLNPVCERLYFKYPSTSATLQVQSNDRLYDVRKKVHLAITTSKATTPLVANLSVSVFKLDSLSTPEQHGITEYFWLTSDLHGTIESPEFYFSADPAAKPAMDNLMLTHGWRRFSWANLHQKTTHQYAPEYRGHIIKAVIRDQEHKPMPGALSFLSSPDKVIRCYPSTSNKSGTVKFETTNLFGNRQLILQTVDSTLKVDLENPFSVTYADNPIPPLTLNSAMRKALMDRSVGMQVQDVYDERNRTRFYPSGVDSVAFFGKADETYFLDDYTRFPVMEEVMREYVPGVLVRKKKDGFHFVLLNRVNGGVLEQDPLILLDGMPIFDTDRIMEFDPRKVQKLEVVTRRYYLGPLTFYGIVSYRTYKGDLGGFRINPNAVTLDYEGLQLQREFYVPTYETTKQRADRTPDFRNLLFWSPEVQTSPAGNAELSFFTSDTPGLYFVKIEGLSDDGTPISGTHQFEVKRFDN